jgi:2-C-methyl-D-erythritol 4-phosphate cytidylyltransferase
VNRSRGKPTIVAVVPAAGSGKRFGPGGDKTLRALAGVPVILRVLATFQSVGIVDEIIPVMKRNEMKAASELFVDAGVSKVRRIAEGGKERQDSVYNALRLIQAEESVVVIHDGARPLVDADLIQRAVEEFLVHPCDGVVPGVPVKDTIKEVEKHIVKKTPAREYLYAIQTPQVFSLATLRLAYERAAEEKIHSTDDASLVERCGGVIRVIEGSHQNIKITTPEDLVMAEALLKS